MEYLQLSKVYVNNIHNKAGTQAMGIDASGNVEFKTRFTTPARPAFWVGMETTTTAANDGIIIFDYVKKNIGSHYSTSTGKFTAPVDGWYQFTFTILYQGVATTDDSLHTHLRVNSAADENTWLWDRADGQDANGYSGSGGYLNSRGAAGMYLSANDTAELYYTCTGAIQVHGNQNKSWSQWSGYLIG